MEKTRDRVYVLLTVMGLALVTLIAFEPVRHNQFINYDDDDYVTENAHVTGGLSRQSIMWAFSTSRASNWHPLTWLSHMLDCQLFGLESGWHHLSSLLFHIANTFLLFWVLRKMTGEVWPSAFVAAVFAVHPLHIESVAWVAERKDVLSSFFWMLTMAAYAWYSERPGIGRYILVFLALALGLMAKPMLVTLPAVLVLLDYWPLCRLRFKRGGEGRALPVAEPVAVRYREVLLRRALGEKIPLFMLSLCSSVVTYIVQQSTGAVKAWESCPLNNRISNAVVSYLMYIVKMFYPTRLAIFYPLRLSIPRWQPVFSLVILTIVSVGVIYMGRRRRYLVVGWLWYIGTLVPVIGLVQVGSQAMADRYTYLPSVGIFIIIAWASSEIFSKWRWRKMALGLSGAAVIGALVICTRLELRYWKNNFTLYERALAVTENNSLVLNNYGWMLYGDGRFDEAIVQLKKVERLTPSDPIVQKNLAETYLAVGQYDQAVSHFEKALELKPDWPGVYNNFGVALKEQGKIEQAIERWKKALALDAGQGNAHYNMGLAMGQRGNYDVAIYHFNQALRSDPDWAEVHYNLGAVYFRLGKLGPAVEECKRAVRLKPDYLSAHATLAQLLVNSGRVHEALETAETALRLAVESGDREVTKEMEELIRFYGEGWPNRQVPAAPDKIEP